MRQYDCGSDKSFPCLGNGVSLTKVHDIGKVFSIHAMNNSFM